MPFQVKKSDVRSCKVRSDRTGKRCLRNLTSDRTVGMQQIQDKVWIWHQILAIWIWICSLDLDLVLDLLARFGFGFGFVG